LDYKIIITWLVINSNFVYWRHRKTRVVENHTTNGKNYTKNGEIHSKKKFVDEIDQKNSI
jgi:hypothetical protein